MSSITKCLDDPYCLTHQQPASRSVPGYRLCPQCQQIYYSKGGPKPERIYHLSQPRAYSLEGAPCFVQMIDFADFMVTNLLPPDESAERPSQM